MNRATNYKVILTIGIIILQFCSFAQEKENIKTLLQNARDHQVRGIYHLGIPEAVNAVYLSEEIQDTNLLVHSLVRLSALQSDSTMFEASLESIVRADGLNLNERQAKEVNAGFARLFEAMDAPKLSLERRLRYPKGNVSAIASLQLKLGNYQKAISAYKELLTRALSKESNYDKMHGFNNLGYSYSVAGYHDSAITMYDSALMYNYTKENGNVEHDFMFGMIHGNIASSLVKSNQFEKAIEHAQIDFWISEEKKEATIHVGAGVLYFEALFESGKSYRAHDVLKDLHQYKDKVETKLQLRIAECELKFYDLNESPLQFKTRLEAYFKLTQEYNNEIKAKKDEYAELLTNFSLDQVNSKLALEKLERQEAENSMKNAQLEKSNSQRTYFIILITVVLLSLIIFIYLRSRRKILELEKAQLDLEIKHKNSDITDLGLNLSRNKEFHDELVHHIRQIKNSNPQNLQSKVSELSRYVNDQLNPGQSTQLFHENVDKVNKEFLTKLEERFPNLTKTEKELCGFIRLNLSNKEISSIKNISSQSVRTNRYRLKKKMQLEEQEDLTQFIQSL